MKVTWLANNVICKRNLVSIVTGVKWYVAGVKIVNWRKIDPTVWILIVVFICVWKIDHIVWNSMEMVSLCVWVMFKGGELNFYDLYNIKVQLKFWW